jgi:hypothetical protein
LAGSCTHICVKTLVTITDQRIFSLLIAIVLLALSGCGQELLDDGSGFLKTKSGDYVSWPSGSKVYFKSDVSVPVKHREHIYLGQEDLNANLGRIQIQVQLEGSSAPKIRRSVDDVIGDGVNGIYYLPEPWPWAEVKGKEDSDAMTVLINRGATIVEADIFYRISTFSKYSDEALGEDRPRMVSGFATNEFIMNSEQQNPKIGFDERWTKVAFIHEAMHAIGFTHKSDERDSIMYNFVSSLLYENPFSLNDLDRIKRLYD